MRALYLHRGLFKGMHVLQIMVFFFGFIEPLFFKLLSLVTCSLSWHMIPHEICKGPFINKV